MVVTLPFTFLPFLSLLRARSSEPDGSGVILAEGLHGHIPGVRHVLLPTCHGQKTNPVIFARDTRRQDDIDAVVKLRALFANIKERPVPFLDRSAVLCFPG